MLVANLDLTRSVACYSLAVRQRPGIYVEILIHGDIDELWKYTQQPSLHESWDLRFTKIQYLPRASDSEPQRFHYTTRIGFGLQIIGQGESTGSREEATGRRTSALKFWSADPKSLIEEGWDSGNTSQPRTGSAFSLGTTIRLAWAQRGAP